MTRYHTTAGQLCLLGLATATLAGCAPPMDREQTLRAPAIRVVGEAVNCVSLNQIENTIVHDDYTIDFELTGGRTYRNTLPNRCYSLGFEERFSYKVSTSRLCDVDMITVLYSDGRTGNSCGLGQFLPVEFVEAE